LIDALNDKNRLIEKQEDLFYEEHDKFVEVEKSLALEKKKNDLLAIELSSCIPAFLSKKLDVCHVASSSLSHVQSAIDVRILILMLVLIMPLPLLS
jgi:hypothetical protein